MSNKDVKLNEENAEDVVFFCKDCSRIVDVDRCGKRYVYKTKECGTKNVAFGSRKSIEGFFRLDDLRKKLQKNGAPEQTCLNKQKRKLPKK